MLEARNGAGPIKAYPRPGSKLKVQATQLNKGSGLQNKTFHCEICDVHVNSEIQLKQVQYRLNSFSVHGLCDANYKLLKAMYTYCTISLDFRCHVSI